MCKNETICCDVSAVPLFAGSATVLELSASSQCLKRMLETMKILKCYRSTLNRDEQVKTLFKI